MRDYSECGYYVDHLVAEHRRLHRILRHMRSAIVSSVGPDITPSFAEVARILGRLRDELELHFTEEDAGGCFDEAVSRCPTLAPAAKGIAAEHPEILAEVNRLIDEAKDLVPTIQNQAAMQQAFERLYQRLRAHENSENHFFAHAFGTHVNDDDHVQPAFHPHLIFETYTRPSSHPRSTS